MDKKVRKRYTNEFKLDAARLVAIQGFTQREAAERLDVNVWSIREWIKKFRASGELPSADEPQPEAEELKRLRAENKRLLIENEILKKATAYFARDQR